MIERTVLDQAIENAVNQVRCCLPKFQNEFKRPNSNNQFYETMDNIEWTTGFFTGEIWLAFEQTNDDVFKQAGLAHVKSFLERIEKKIDVDHHDLGFLYTPSCVGAYRLLNDETAKKAAIMAADYLCTRFQAKGEFIQAWGALGAKENYRLIIDCLLNLPLLYWASEVTNDPKYKEIAKKHITTTLKVIIRDDYSTYHTYFFDPETGLPSHGVSHQGNRNESAWARGQAWGIYGLALSYKYTQNEDYLRKAKKVSEYFVSHLPKNAIPYWDFDFNDGSDEPRDSSAAAIAVCGMLELAKYTMGYEQDFYLRESHRMLDALIKECSVKDSLVSNGQLLHGVYCKSTETNGCKNHGVDECNSWGDYFYFEALMRVSKDWNLYW